jgi:hypothetical protein
MLQAIIRRLPVLLLCGLAFGISGTPAALGQQLYRMGPSGGVGGGPFFDKGMPSGSRVSEVRVRHGAWIDAVQMIHKLSDGQPLSLPRHGGGGGTRSVFRLGPGEYLRAVSGRYGRFVDSIRFYSNMKSSPLYGGRGGAVDFYYQAPADYEIVGFLGRSGKFLDSIGVVLRRR